MRFCYNRPRGFPEREDILWPGLLITKDLSILLLIMQRYIKAKGTNHVEAMGKQGLLHAYNGLDLANIQSVVSC